MSMKSLPEYVQTWRHEDVSPSRIDSAGSTRSSSLLRSHCTGILNSENIGNSSVFHAAYVESMRRPPLPCNMLTRRPKPGNVEVLSHVRLV